MHPATLYSYTIAVIALIGVIVLIALHDLSPDVGVPIISAIALGGIGAGAGIQQANNAQIPPSSETGPGA